MAAPGGAPVPTWRRSTGSRLGEYIRLDARGGSAQDGSVPSAPGPSGSRPAGSSGDPAPKLTAANARGRRPPPQPKAAGRGRAKRRGGRTGSARLRIRRQQAAAQKAQQATSSKASAGSGVALRSRSEIREAKAVKRKAEKLEPLPGTNLTECELRSVSAKTREEYKIANAEFEEWALLNGFKKLHDPPKLDDALAAYISDELFMRGEEPVTARYALFGTLWLRGLARSKTALPRSRKALTGFTKEAPEAAGEPIPIEALALLCMDLMGRDSLMEKTAGLAALLQFDLFARPSEMLSIVAEDVFLPRGQYSTTSVMIAPLQIKHSVVAPKPSKAGQFDETILAGLTGLGLEWVVDLLHRLKSGAQPQMPVVSPLDIAHYEKHFKEGMDRIGLAHLNLTPHSLRHGGASLASYLGLLTNSGVAKRGRWNSMQSVRRYEKKGVLTRVVAKMKPEQVRAGSAHLKDGSLKKLAMKTAADIVRLRREYSRLRLAAGLAAFKGKKKA